MSSGQWRELSLTYEVPEGLDWEEVEDRMVDLAVVAIGCQGQLHQDECRANWIASSRPIEEESPCLTP